MLSVLFPLKFKYKQCKKDLYTLSRDWFWLSSDEFPQMIEISGLGVIVGGAYLTNRRALLLRSGPTPPTSPQRNRRLSSHWRAAAAGRGMSECVEQSEFLCA